MKNIIFSALLASVLFGACNNRKYDDYGEFLNRQLKEHYFAYFNYDTIIIIPREGCNACINEANSFFENNRNNASYLFIFTKLSTQKELIIKFGDEVLNAENVLIDKRNLFYIFDEADSHYPLLLTKKSSSNFSYNQLSL